MLGGDDEKNGNLDNPDTESGSCGSKAGLRFGEKSTSAKSLGNSGKDAHHDEAEMTETTTELEEVNGAVEHA